LLGKYSHIAIVDNNVTVPAEFYSLHEKFDADIIEVYVEPSSPVFRSAVESDVLGETSGKGQRLCDHLSD